MKSSSLRDPCGSYAWPCERAVVPEQPATGPTRRVDYHVGAARLIAAVRGGAEFNGHRRDSAGVAYVMPCRVTRRESTRREWFMSKVVGIAFPLFALIALGFLAHRKRLVNDDTPSVLINFVYYFLLPPFLVMKIVDADVKQGLDITVLFAYYLAVGMVFMIAYWTSRRAYSSDRKIIAIRSLASIAANTGYLGLPIVVLAYGNRAIIPGVAIVLLDNLIVLLGGSLLLEAAGSRGVRWRKIATDSLGKIVRNPLIMSIISGLLYVLLIGVVPEPVRVLGRLMADATLPCALFALGATLAQRSATAPAVSDRYQIILLKQFGHPFLAFVLARYVFDLASVDVAIVVVMAAMPVSVNTFIMATRYNVYVKEISSILLMTTVFSMFVITALLFAFS